MACTQGDFLDPLPEERVTYTFQPTTSDGRTIYTGPLLLAILRTNSMNVGFFYAIGAAMAWGMVYQLDERILTDIPPDILVLLDSFSRSCSCCH